MHGEYGDYFQTLLCNTFSVSLEPAVEAQNQLLKAQSVMGRQQTFYVNIEFTRMASIGCLPPRVWMGPVDGIF